MVMVDTKSYIKKLSRGGEFGIYIGMAIEPLGHQFHGEYKILYQEIKWGFAGCEGN